MLDPRFTDAASRLPDYFGSHIAVSLTALAVGLAISIPLSLASLRRPRLRTALLTSSSIVQTIPGLALLALFYPLLLALTALSQRFLGVGFSALGFLPAVLALALYSMLPVVRNTITGIEGIDPAAKRAAIGVGMTERQSLRMVELPLALPIIMAGIRTAAVLVIGTATLSTPIGQTSLGNYIFTGLQTQNWLFVLFGCVSAAVLALVVDQLLALLERAYSRRDRRLAVGGFAGLAAVALLAIAPAIAARGTAATYVIGAKPFAEQYILADLIKQRLGVDGLTATTREGLGSAVIDNALAANDIDVYVEYTGTVWANQMKHTDVAPPAEVLTQVSDWLQREQHVTVLGSLGFENAYALAISKKKADELHIATLADLAAHSATMSIAGDPEFFARPEWRAMRDAYGLKFRQQRQMQAEFMYPAAAAADVDVISAYTSDGRVAQYDLKVLDDPKHVTPPYEAIMLVSPKRANDKRFLDALRPLTGAIPVDLMRDANRRASEGASPPEAAAWLAAKIAGKVTK